MNVWLEELEPLTSFILPSGDGPVALLQLARTVVRRLERRLVELNENEGIRDFTLVYCNRLSDWCFVLARWITHRLDGTEVLWRPIGERSSSEANRTLIQRDHTNIDDVLKQLDRNNRVGINPIDDRSFALVQLGMRIPGKKHQAQQQAARTERFFHVLDSNRSMARGTRICSTIC